VDSAALVCTASIASLLSDISAANLSRAFSCVATCSGIMSISQTTVASVLRCPHYLNESCTGEAPLRGRRRAGAHPPDQSTAVAVGVPAQGRGGTPDSQPVPAGDQADQVRACAAVALLCMGQWAMTRLYFSVSSLTFDATARGGLANVARKSDVHRRM
jgi:hypothetical protein